MTTARSSRSADRNTSLCTLRTPSHAAISRTTGALKMTDAASVTGRTSLNRSLNFGNMGNQTAAAGIIACGWYP